MPSVQRRADGQHGSFNWGFMLLLGVCVEFWVIMTTVVTQNL